MPAERTDIVVEITCDCQNLEVDFDRLNRLAEKICQRFFVSQATVSIAIVDDDLIRKVNKKFLNRPDRTDVISFDLSDDKDIAKSFELLINADEAARQASKRGHSIEAELALYITHGLLHNLGFDDTEDIQARKMHKMEDKILQQAGFGIVYDK